LLVPWKETCRVDQRRRFVLEWRSGTVSKTALCQLFGISRQTGYKWAGRFKRTMKWSAIEDQNASTTSQSKGDTNQACEAHPVSAAAASAVGTGPDSEATADVVA
jgi:hypothetical protein